MPGEPIPIVDDDPAALRLAGAALSAAVYGVATCMGAAARVLAEDRGQAERFESVIEQLRVCLRPKGAGPPKWVR